MKNWLIIAKYAKQYLLDDLIVDPALVNECKTREKSILLQDASHELRISLNMHQIDLIMGRIDKSTFLNLYIESLDSEQSRQCRILTKSFKGRYTQETAQMSLAPENKPIKGL